MTCCTHTRGSCTPAPLVRLAWLFFWSQAPQSFEMWVRSWRCGQEPPSFSDVLTVDIAHESQRLRQLCRNESHNISTLPGPHHTTVQSSTVSTAPQSPTRPTFSLEWPRGRQAKPVHGPCLAALQFVACPGKEKGRCSGNVDTVNDWKSRNSTDCLHTRCRTCTLSSGVMSPCEP